MHKGKQREKRGKNPSFPHFSTSLFFPHFPSRFDIILHLIKVYKKLFTLSTDFSTHKKSFIHKAFLRFHPVIHHLQKVDFSEMPQRIMST